MRINRSIISNFNPDADVTFGDGVTVTSLAGTGSRMVIADSVGLLSTQAIPSGTVTSITASAPLTGGTITSSGTIGITQASATTNGYLSSTDWTTFNNKQPQLNGTGFVKASGTSISYDNTSYLPLSGGTLSSASISQTLRLVNTSTGYGLYNQSDSYFQGDVKFQSVNNTILKVDSSNKLIAAVAGTDYQAPLTNPVTGTGTTNYIPKWTSASAIGNSLVYDNGTNVGIGTTSPNTKIDVLDGVVSAGISSNITQSNIYFEGYGYVISSTRYGRVGIGGTYNNGSNNSSLDFYTTGDSGYDRKMIITNNGNVGIGTTSPNSASVDRALTISGTSNSILEINYGSTRGGYFFTNSINTVLSSVQNVPLLFNTNDVTRLTIAASTGAATFSSSVSATNLTLSGEINSTVTGSFFLANAVANVTYPTYGFQANTGVGMYRPATDVLGFVTSATERMRITSDGNTLLGTTVNPGDRLYINGTLKSRFSDGSSGASLRFGSISPCSTLNGDALTVEINGTIYYLALADAP